MIDRLYVLLADIYYRLRLITNCPQKFWIDNHIFFLYTEDDEEPRLWRIPWVMYRR